MNAKKFKRIIYLIAVTVLITVSIQVYRNVQNYQLNKQRFMLDVQQSLDLAIESYFADRARNDVVIFSEYTPDLDTLLGDSSSWSLGGVKVIKDSQQNALRSYSDFSSYFTKGSGVRDTLKRKFSINAVTSITVDTTEDFKFSGGNLTVSVNDSSQLTSMAKKILLSLVNSKIDFERLNGFMREELERKNISLKYYLVHQTQDSTYISLNDLRGTRTLVSSSKSTYLRNGETLDIKYENSALTILRRGMLDLFISLLITGVVLGALLYLYKIINQQKELAEIKNDLISNITHEFKTPIATISTAIEGISNFNEANDLEKTAKYLDISSGQLKKLNGMVEKLLETASLDSDELNLSLESVELVSLTRQIFERFHLLKGAKELSFQTSMAEAFAEVDVFHLENAIANLLDNALKYGGDKVSLSFSNEDDSLVWRISDNGGRLDKTQQARIFDKFYRVPTGNVHDVKGFGIGLYYTKKIAEKHNGSVRLEVANNNTTFTFQI